MAATTTRMALLLALLLAVAAQQQQLALAQQLQREADDDGGSGSGSSGGELEVNDGDAAGELDSDQHSEAAIRARLVRDRAELDDALANPRAAFDGLVAKLVAGGHVPTTAGAGSARGAAARGAAGAGAARKRQTMLPFVPGGAGDRLTKAARLRVFRRNLAEIRARNLAQSDVVHGVTPFTALTQKEFEDLMLVKGGLKVAPAPEEMRARGAGGSSSLGGRRRLLQCNTVSTWVDFKKTALATITPKNTVNWKAAGMVTAVRDQGGCGSCVAFASTALAEFWAMSKPALKSAGWNATTVDLSEQDIMRCVVKDSQGTTNKACNGAYTNDYVGRLLCNGQATEAAVPYTATDNNVCPTGVTRYKGTANAWTSVPQQDPTALRQAITAAPVMVSIDATYLSSYKSGIVPCNAALVVNGVSRTLSLNHAVAAVGYTANYLIIKNSWSTTWGNSGYLYLKRDCTGNGALGVTQNWSLAMLKV